MNILYAVSTITLLTAGRAPSARPLEAYRCIAGPAAGAGVPACLPLRPSPPRRQMSRYRSRSLAIPRSLQLYILAKAIRAASQRRDAGHPVPNLDILGEAVAPCLPTPVVRARGACRRDGGQGRTCKR